MLLESFQMFPIFLSNKKCRLEHVVNKLMSCLITEFLFLHGHAMAFHETASVLQGTPWHSMELYNTPWNSIDLHQYFMELRGTLWHSMELHGYSRELHGIPWNSMDTPWNSMGFHGTPWILHGYSMEVPWNSMDFHRFPWISMEFHGGISHG